MIFSILQYLNFTTMKRTKYCLGIFMVAALGLGTMSLSSCSDEVNYQESTAAVVTSITTGDATVTAISAVTTGNVQNLSTLASNTYQVGTIFSTNADPTVGGTRQLGSIDEAGNVTASLSNLIEGTTYYYATYVTLQGKVTKYGEVKSFVATDADVATAGASNVTACKATFNGQATGVDEIVATTKVGFKYALDANAVQDGIEVAIAEPSASFSSTVKGLIPGKTYYYAAYTKVGDGYIYGNTQEFTTAAQTMEYVDLGLSTTWAKCNIGAEAEEECGALAGFGDQLFFSHSANPDDYMPWDIAGTEEDMVAGLSIDGDFPMSSKMPTIAQVEELIAKTTQKEETVNGVNGIRFTAANGNSIFLPMAGYRNGDEIVENDEAYYWTGNVSEINDTYAKTLKVSADGAVKGVSARALGICLRTVRDYAVITPIPGKCVVGDLENNGRIRIEIYNEYGSTKGNCGIDPNSIKFKQNMVVTFNISGIDGNMKEGSPAYHVAGLEYSDPTWGPSYWSGLDMGKYEAAITGDGTYVVWCEAQNANGAIVFCIDIKDLSKDAIDPSLIKADVVSIKLDADVSPVVNDAKNFYQGDNPADGRIQVFNPWNGLNIEGYYDDGKLDYTGMFIVDFTITGIDGNLKAGAPASFKAGLSFADKNWGNGYWGGNDYGNAEIMGDGSYSTFFYNPGNSEGIVFSCVELYNLWENLVDPSLVKVSVDKITAPGRK